jgi:hypothetical protein
VSVPCTPTIYLSLFPLLVHCDRRGGNWSVLGLSHLVRWIHILTDLNEAFLTREWPEIDRREDLDLWHLEGNNVSLWVLARFSTWRHVLTHRNEVFLMRRILPMWATTFSDFRTLQVPGGLGRFDHGEYSKVQTKYMYLHVEWPHFWCAKLRRCRPSRSRRLRFMQVY